MKQLTIWEKQGEDELRLRCSLELMSNMPLPIALQVCEILNESLADGLMCAVMVTEVTNVSKDE